MNRLCSPLTTLALSFLALALTASHGLAQDAPGFAGHWEGGIHTPQGDLGINVDMAQAEDGSWSGDISIPAQGAADIPLADVVVEGTTITFKMADVPGEPTFSGTLSEDGKTISGPFTQGGAELTFTLTRTDP